MDAAIARHELGHILGRYYALRQERTGQPDRLRVRLFQDAVTFEHDGMYGTPEAYRRVQVFSRLAPALLASDDRQLGKFSLTANPMHLGDDLAVDDKAAVHLGPVNPITLVQRTQALKRILDRHAGTVRNMERRLVLLTSQGKTPRFRVEAFLGPILRDELGAPLDVAV